MKQYLIAVIGGAAILIASCKEKGPAIDFSDVTSVETTYVSAPADPQSRNVLVEEATGVKCPNCPAGAKMLKELDSVSGGRLVIIGLHEGNLTTPLVGGGHDSKYDFRNAILQGLYQFFNVEPNKPAAVFDRTSDGVNYFIDNRNKWPGIVNTRLQVPSPVRLSMTSSYNPNTHEDTIRIEVSYTQPVSKKQSLVIAITENHIIDPQYDGTNVVEDYEHEHVFRDYVTPLNGSDFLDDLATKEAGRVYKRTFIYKVPEKAYGEERFRWNLDNCKVVGYVFNNQSPDFEVAQAIEIDMISK